MPNDVLLAYRLLKKREWLLAVHTIRDLPITEELGLHTLAWSYVQQGCAYNEAVELLEKIFKYYENEGQEQAWITFSEPYFYLPFKAKMCFDAGFSAGMNYQKGLQ